MAEPKRLPLVASIANRDATTDKDARLVNGFFERTAKDELWVFKRPGLSAQGTSVGASTGRGVYNWNGNLYAVFGSVLYKNAVSHGTGLNTTGPYTFSASLGGTPRLFLQNGAAAYVTDGTTFSTVTDVDYPAATVPGNAYLDGTTYVMTSAANIRGSDLNNPTAWDVLNSLIAQIEPDPGVAIAKQLSFVIALKGWTTEVFFDAANAAGSPLKVSQGQKQAWGCRAAAGVQAFDDILIWPAQTRLGGVSVVKMEGLKTQIVSTPAIDRLLAGADFTTTYSWSMRIQGHRFYGLTSTATNLTLVYDLKENLWSQWADTSGNYWPIVSSTFDSSQRVVLQHASNGKLYFASTTTYTDDGDLFSWDLYTPQFDGDVKVKKFCPRLELVGDRREGSLLDVRVNDDDYHPDKWSHYRTVDLGQLRPALENMGSFRRRAHHFHHRAAHPLRLEGVELFLDLGTL